MSRAEVKQRRRAGGRLARTAARSRPLDEAVRPVRPGMPGGFYQVLKDTDVQRIHEAALQALEVIGFASAPPSGRAILTGAGAIEGDDGRIRFPRALVEDMLAKAARDITLKARDPKFDLHLSGKNVHFGTAGAAVHIVDPKTGTTATRMSRTCTTLRAWCSNWTMFTFFQRPVVCREFESPRDLDVNTVYAACAGTTKHIGTSFTEAANVAPAMELLHLMAGGEDAWRERPFVSNSNCFVVPPLTFAEESCEVMEACIHAGMPVLLLSAGQAGATAPAPIATAVVQAVAECLAGVVYVNAIKPGHTAMFGTCLSSAICAQEPCPAVAANRPCSVPLRSDASLLWSSRWRCRRHCRQQASRHAGRVGTRHQQCHGRTVRPQYGLRGRRHARLPAGLLQGIAGARQ